MSNTDYNDLSSYEIHCIIESANADNDVNTIVLMMNRLAALLEEEQTPKKKLKMTDDLIPCKKLYTIHESPYE